MQTIQVRKSSERGYANRGWLESYHSFSFAEYHDPQYMHFSTLRVINEDVIGPAQGFGMHPHNNMEIVTYMLQGALQHTDNMGHSSVIKSGDVQRMTAGTGVMHSEVNASKTEDAHLLQIWILPERLHLQPSYEEKHFSASEKSNQWCLIASNDGREESLVVHQDMLLYATILSPDVTLEYVLNTRRSAYLQVATGEVEANGQSLAAGDALMLDGMATLEIKAATQAELLLFDLPLHIA